MQQTTELRYYQLDLEVVLPGNKLNVVQKFTSSPILTINLQQITIFTMTRNKQMNILLI